MKLYFLTLLLVAILHISLGAQTEEVLVQYYFSTDDFLQDNLSAETVRLQVKSMGSDFIYVRDIVDIITGKHSANGWKAWAIEHEGNAYQHLTYSYNSKAPGVFIRIDIKGRFCLAIMDEGSEDSMKSVPGYYGGGMINSAAIAIAESASKGVGKFLDKEGNSKLIFIIDTKDLSIVLPYKAKNAPAEVLTKSTLKWLVGKEYWKGSVSDYTVEEVKAIVEDLNERQ